MSSDIVKVGLVQMSCSAEVALNKKKAFQKVKELAGRGAQIVCLQELFSSLYFCQSEDHNRFEFSEPVPGPTTEFAQTLARECGVVIVASLFERRTKGVYHNTAAVIDADGTFLGKYRKMHIPDDPNYYEKFYFTPGDLGFVVFNTKFARVGVLICWDQWYPEAARLMALRGADIIFYPTAIGWHKADKGIWQRQFNAWKLVQVGHAIANEVFVVAVNRVGKEADMTFWGGSFVADPFGESLFQAGHGEEETAVVACDLKLIEEHRRAWPFLRDRRIDAYQNLLKRFVD